MCGINILGQAGRVHVSETTLGFLNDEFEVEPAHGEKREEILRIAGIKTYFIVCTNIYYTINSLTHVCKYEMKLHSLFYYI